MGLWNWLFKREAESTLNSMEFRTAFTLYSEDGKRAAEVREFSNGKTYLMESEWVEDIFVARHEGQMVGPFKSAAHAEKFIVATSWFAGETDTRHQTV